MTGMDVAQITISLLVGVAAGIISGVILKRMNKPTILILCVVAAFFIIGVVVTAYNYPIVALQEIPDLTGLSKDEADLRLLEKGLIPIFIEQYSDSVDMGKVIFQDLSPGLRVRKGSEVHFVVSKGPPSIHIIDGMNSTSGWEIGKDDKGSSINIKSVHGRTGNAIEISYDLKEGGYVTMYKEIDPEILSGTELIKFFYKGSGEPNTIQLGLKYRDVNETIFGVSLDRKTVAEDWVYIEVPYTHFDCWWPDVNCQYYGDELDLRNVGKIGFGIQNYPREGDVNGSGRLIIDDVHGITS